MMMSLQADLWIRISGRIRFFQNFGSGSGQSTPRIHNSPMKGIIKQVSLSSRKRKGHEKKLEELTLCKISPQKSDMRDFKTLLHLILSYDNEKWKREKMLIANYLD